MRIETEDNSLKSNLLESKSDYYDLIKIANSPLKKIVEQNKSLLVFPHVLGKYYDDRIDELPIFSLSGNPEKLDTVELSTGNLMGFIGIGDTKLVIRSRFSSKDNDWFLYYMLQKVFSINVFDLKNSQGKDGELDLLMFSFPILLKKALSQGIFRTYQKYQRNDAKVRGTIDVNRYIKFDIPFNGRIAYTSRDRTADNSMTQLIRHTIEFMRRSQIGKSVISSSKDIQDMINEIVEVTPSYVEQNRQKVIFENLKSFSHPYFTAYKPLQKLCLEILNRKKIGYADSNDQAYGILFDGAWLWEEYLATVLKGFVHPKNKTSQNGIHLYSHCMRYPDFYKGKQLNSDDLEIQNAWKKPTRIVLDAKYKRLNTQSESDTDALFEDEDENVKVCLRRDDVHQLVTYMHILPASTGRFIYPIQGIDDKASVVGSNPKQLFGLGGSIGAVGIKIPSCSKYEKFKKEMDEQITQEAIQSKLQSEP